MSKLDLNIIPTYNKTTIAIGDASVYSSGITITSPSLEVSVPGYDKISVSFTPNSLNVYNSNTLKVTDEVTQEDLVFLPDGIWKMKYSINPAYENYIDISFLKTDLIEEKFDNAWLSLNIDECDKSLLIENKSTLEGIWDYIIAAQSSAKVCNYSLAIGLYKAANEKLDEYLKINCYGMSDCKV